jgi:hypothetical protein
MTSMERAMEEALALFLSNMYQNVEHSVLTPRLGDRHGELITITDAKVQH